MTQMQRVSYTHYWTFLYFTLISRKQSFLNASGMQTYLVIGFFNVYTPSYLLYHTFPLFLLMSRRDDFITQTASPYFRTVLVNAFILPVVFLFITLIILEGDDYLACKHKISFMSLALYIASRIQYTLKILLNKVVHFERNYFNLK